MHTVIQAVVNRYASKLYRNRFEVHACTVSTPHVRMKKLFHKLICVIKIFMRKFSWFSAIHEVFLTSNYFRTTVVSYTNMASYSYMCKLHIYLASYKGLQMQYVSSIPVYLVTIPPRIVLHE